jgi:hypothetical protein
MDPYARLAVRAAAWATAALVATWLCGAPPVAASELAVSIDFEGGSAHVESIDQRQRVVRLTPSFHPGRGWRCWWYLKLSGIEPGETITLEVGDAPWATPDRAAVSLDNRTWGQTEPGRREGRRIVYRHRVDAAEAWFAWGPPFGVRDAAALVERVARRSFDAEAFELCRSREGRPTPALHVTAARPAAAPRRGVWVIARQHAWESGSSWVCRGMIEWLVSDDPRAEALRGACCITFVPVMDVDNVALGAGGKGQQPHDHNRDWSDDPYFPAVAAVIEGIRELDAEGRFDLFLDLHNPGAADRRPFYYFPPQEPLDPIGRRNHRRFFQASRAEIDQPMKLAELARVSGADYDRLWRRMSKNWVVAHTREHVVAVTLEVPWNTPHGTTEGYMAIGRQLGLTVERYFRDDPRAAVE